MYFLVYSFTKSMHMLDTVLYTGYCRRLAADERYADFGAVDAKYE